MNFNDFIGQDAVKDTLKICLRAAQIENRAIPHTVLLGQSGCGKSTTAKLCAKELCSDYQYVNCASLRAVKDILPFISRITEKSVLFLDELHEISKFCEEILYSIIDQNS